jgi:hypothetical protein
MRKLANRYCLRSHTSALEHHPDAKETVAGKRMTAIGAVENSVAQRRRRFECLACGGPAQTAAFIGRWRDLADAPATASVAGIARE